MGVSAEHRRVATTNGLAGYTLVEMVVVIIIIGVMAAVATRALRHVHEVARIEETRAELDRLAWAIAGNPSLTSGGARTDYGYVGDVGSMPPDLAALVANPGLTTWHGPYLDDDHLAASGATPTSYALDAWGKPYLYSGGKAITSTGGPLPLTRNLAPATGDLLRNAVSVVVTDLSGTPPGQSHADSILLVLEFPRAGELVTRSACPAPDGSAVFDSVPIGRHVLRLVHRPSHDTLTRPVSVDPGSHAYLELQWPEEVFR